VAVNLRSGNGIKVVKAGLVSRVEFARHDSANLASTIFSIIAKSSAAARTGGMA
jgi:hypothetical protein